MPPCPIPPSPSRRARRLLACPGVWPLLVAGAACCATASARAPAPDRYRALLSRDAVGAATFTREHPTWDGRGVVIAVLDTGVDPSVAGLGTTPEGGPKILDTRDFSGEGDVELDLAERVIEGGEALLRVDGGTPIRGVEAALGAVKPAGGKLWLGFFREDALRRSAIDDVNRDGDADDAFAIVAFRPQGTEAPVAIVDTDGDGDLADESLRRSYRDDPRWFAFSHADPRRDQTPVAFTLTVFPDDARRVELHFDDGGHGTHVAGIAAGHQVHGRDGYDGIAPGARVLSLKIGDNSLAGGATTPGSMRSAIRYASRWARDHQVPVVINLSYGIGSEIEGASGIDRVLDAELTGNPLLTAVVAAGNEGPGLSTVGTPGASRLAFTAGALLTRDNAEALWGRRISQPRVFAFSSRGGELDKPDAIAPGVAWSTVPPFLDHAVMAGTSMATPQMTGVHALLISAALDQQVTWTSGLVKRALRATARPVPGYGPLDQGRGLVQIPAAFDSLRRVSKQATDATTLLAWRVETPVAHRPGREGGDASYWRTGAWVPDARHPISFTIEPVFVGTAPESARAAFFETLELLSDSPWLRVDRKRVAVRGEQSAVVRATLDPSAFGRAGVYSGAIVATPSGQSAPAFHMPVHVVMPHTFRAADTRARRFAGGLEPGAISRFFVEVPAGATTMTARLRVPDGQYGDLWLNVHDPEGRPLTLSEGHAMSERGLEARLSLGPDDLAPGVWELVVYGGLSGIKTSRWEMEVSFAGLEIEPVLGYVIEEGAGLAASGTIVNRFETPYSGTLTGVLRGYVRQHTLEIEGARERTVVSLGPGARGARLTLSVDADTYNLFTDIAVDVIDASGTVVTQTGFGSREVVVAFEAPPGDYTLEIVGATAASADDDDVSWTVDVEELHLLASPLPLSAEGPDGSALTFYPGVPVDVGLATSVAPSEPPSGFLHAARLTWSDRLRRGAPSLRFDVVME